MTDMADLHSSLVYTGKFKSKFPHYDVEVLDYILYTNGTLFDISSHSSPSSQKQWEDGLMATLVKANITGAMTLRQSTRNGVL